MGIESIDCRNEKKMYSFRLSSVSMNLARERISGSENGRGPAYTSEQGFVDEPTSAIDALYDI